MTLYITNIFPLYIPVIPAAEKKSVDFKNSFPQNGVLWKERRQAILQAASCGRKDVKLSCKQRLVDGENALEYPSSSNLRAEKTLRQPTSRDNWTSHKTSQAKPSLRRCCHEIFRDWLTEGLIERVKENPLERRGYYLPHRPVYKMESKTTPILEELKKEDEGEYQNEAAIPRGYSGTDGETISVEKDLNNLERREDGEQAYEDEALRREDEGQNETIILRRSSRIAARQKEYCRSAFHRGIVEHKSHQDEMPSSYEEALNMPKAQNWLRSIECEMASLREHRVWDVDLPGRVKRRPNQDLDHSRPPMRTTNESRQLDIAQDKPSQAKPATVLPRAVVSEEDTWVIDSGATHHMTPNRRYFSTLNDENVGQVTTIDGTSHSNIGRGNAQVDLINNSGQLRSIVAQNAMFVPGIRHGVLSVLQIVENGHEVIFDKKGCHIYDNDHNLMIRAEKRGRLYLVRTAPSRFPESGECSNSIAQTNNFRKFPLKLWHQRLMHINYDTIVDMMKREVVIGLNCQAGKPDKCSDCMIGKSTKRPFLNLRSTKETQTLALVHCDLMGPFNIESWGGSRFVLTIIDDASRYTRVYFLKRKGDTLEKFKEWMKEAENQTGFSLKRIRTDNGLEFCSSPWDIFTKAHGIVHERTMVYTPEQNGVAERMNRTLLNLVRSTVNSCNLPTASWAELTNTAAYLRNRVTNRHNEEKTPFELWFGKRPALQHLRAIGCETFVHVPKQRRNSKLQPRATKGILVGYSLQGRGGIDKLSETLPENLRSHPMALRSHGKTAESPEEDNCGGQINATSAEDNNPTYEEAMNSPEVANWIEAIEEERESLERHDVWQLQELPKGIKPLKCRWVLNKKINAVDGTTRYKARLVAKGFTQRRGIDYNEVYTPVSSFETIRLLTAIATEKDWFIDQFDVKSAYLHGTLNETIYMEQPECFKKPGEENLFCKLKKSIYGLKQSGRCWNKFLNKQLHEIGFQRNPIDPSIYEVELEERRIILSIYVDDIFAISENQAARNKCRELLNSSFEVKYLGPISHMLGVSFKKSEDGSMTLSQSNYIEELLQRFRLQEAKGVSTPLETNLDLRVRKNGNSNERFPYRELIGGLSYLSQRTRPDIAYAVGILSRYCDNYTREHWEAGKRVLRYLKSTKDFGITYRSTGKPLIAFSDASWASDIVDRKGVSGHLIILAGAPIIWRSTKQTVTALSTMESEYIALSSAVKDITWVRNLMEQLKMSSLICGETKVFCDNQAAISHAENYIDKSKKKTRHFAVKYHFVREKISEEAIEIFYTPSAENPADFLTKPLARSQHEKCKLYRITILCVCKCKLYRITILCVCKCKLYRITILCVCVNCTVSPSCVFCKLYRITILCVCKCKLYRITILCVCRCKLYRITILFVCKCKLYRITILCVCKCKLYRITILCVCRCKLYRITILCVCKCKLYRITILCVCVNWHVNFQYHHPVCLGAAFIDHGTMIQRCRVPVPTKENKTPERDLSGGSRRSLDALQGRAAEGKHWSLGR
ncbi:hypothetical protein LAZ67_3005531 [Cordylochernes scorpioides]|uniref:Integrase catalytic domain-containing protein n=1 Tax=Cordylochernes scorpioides TaxID=51811 RepID=A0ABY6KAU0_9ARAC|nr:hypothetical protein LAZ67_3005531 [Cordylochernes scorpioides]